MREFLDGVPRRAVVAVIAVLVVLTGAGVALAVRSARSPAAGEAAATESPTAAESSAAPAAEVSQSAATTGSASASAAAEATSPDASVSASASAAVPSSAAAASASPGAAAPGAVTPSPAPGGEAAPAAPAPAGAAGGPVVRPEFFGLHIHSPVTNWPDVPFGSIRLWDSGVTWKDIQPTRTTWNFATLDAQVAKANRERSDIIMVLGVTPPWAASRPAEEGNYGAGTASEPKDIAAWTEYVRRLAERYRGKITKWEIWNEPNAKLFWNAKPETMIPLAKAAYTVLKAADRNNLVLSPGIVVRTENSPLWLDQYLAAGGGRYSDVIAAHFYVRTGQRPEHLRPSIERIQAIMSARKVADKPLWNTESSFGQVRQPTEIFNEPIASAYVVRSLALFAGHGVERAYWYAWDDHGFTGLYLTRPNGQPTPAGKAFGLMSDWLVGSRGHSCERLAAGRSEGAFACHFSRGDERFQVVWHPGKTAQYDVPAGYRTVRRLDGSRAQLTGATVPVTPVPVLITTAAS